MAIRKIFLRLLKTVVLSIGAIVRSTGTKIFGINAFFNYFNINCKAAIIPIKYLAIFSMSYVFTFTRGLYVWKYFNPQTQLLLDDLNKRNLNSLGKSFASISSTFTTIAGLMVAGLAAFLASDELFRFFGVNNTIVLNILDLYISASLMYTFIRFEGKIARKNAIFLAEKITFFTVRDNTNLFDGNNNKKLKKIPLIIVSILGIFRTVAQTALANFTTKSALEIIPWIREISLLPKQIIAGSIAITATLTFSIVKTLQLYKFFDKNHARQGKVAYTDSDSHQISSTGKILTTIQQPIAGLYLLYFGCLYYISCIDAEKQLGINDNYVSTQLFSILAAFASTLTEYAFSIREMNAAVKEEFSSQANTQEENRSLLINPSDQEPIYQKEELSGQLSNV